MIHMSGLSLWSPQMLSSDAQDDGKPHRSSSASAGGGGGDGYGSVHPQMSTQGVLPSQTRQGFGEPPQDAKLVRVLEGIGTSASRRVRKDVGKSEFSVKTGRQSSSPHWVLGSGGRPEQVCLQWPLEKEATASGTETHTLSSAPVGRPSGFGYEMAMISPPPGIESCQPRRSLPLLVMETLVATSCSPKLTPAPPASSGWASVWSLSLPLTVSPSVASKMRVASPILTASATMDEAPMCWVEAAKKVCTSRPHPQARVAFRCRYTPRAMKSYLVPAKVR